MLSGEQKLYHLQSEWNKEKINTWQYIKINDYVRLYYKDESNNEGLGFVFFATKITAHSIDNEIWHLDSNAYCVFQGTAAFDGTRHLYMGDEQEDGFGYINYPNFDELIEILKQIQLLEKKYCRESYL